ncbi:hypothetical protein NQ176_g8196 [Zarea fungicola]|uniref:Uncharacterized protein n=1 Tax=Zarea fungicola TaxID=93591 RepID=A0ACC1MVZ1_9HYPO|nr:hypothetical protein NQ176_g8196 [Lecanicillium fungicola]
MAHVFRIVTIALNSEASFDEWYAPLLATVKSKTEYSKVEDTESAITVLSRRPPPSAILIPDEGMTGRDSLAEWDAVLKYIRIGGTAIVFGGFPSFAQFDDIKAFFARAGLPWDIGSYTRATLVINKSVVNVAPEHMWYRVADEEEPFMPSRGEAAVVLGNVGDGKLGFVGDVDGEAETQKIIAAMCGLNDT